MKKLLSTIIIGVMVFSLSACGQNSSNSKKTTTTTTTTTMTATTTTTTTTTTAKNLHTEYFKGLAYDISDEWSKAVDKESTEDSDAVYYTKNDNSTLFIFLIGNYKKYVDAVGQQDEYIIDYIEDFSISYFSIDDIEDLLQIGKYRIDNERLSGFHYLQWDGSKTSHHYVLMDDRGECVLIRYQNSFLDDECAEADMIVNSMRFETEPTSETVDNSIDQGKMILTYTDAYLYGVSTKEQLAKLIYKHLGNIENQDVKNMAETIYEAANDSTSTMEDIKAYRNILALTIGEEMMP